jgi:hypothetical protein
MLYLLVLLVLLMLLASSSLEISTLQLKIKNGEKHRIDENVQIIVVDTPFNVDLGSGARTRPTSGALKKKISSLRMCYYDAD